MTTNYREYDIRELAVQDLRAGDIVAYGNFSVIDRVVEVLPQRTTSYPDAVISKVVVDRLQLDGRDLDPAVRTFWYTGNQALQVVLLPKPESRDDDVQA